MLGLGLGLPAVATRGGSSGPSLDLDFMGGQLDERISFARTSTATYFDASGVLRTSGYNLALWSEDFSNAVWSRVRCSISPNATTAPDGTLTADKLQEQTDTATNRSAAQNLSVTSGTTYTISVYAKPAERSGINLRFATGFAAGNVTFDLIGMTAVPGGTVAGSSIVSAGNGWVRCSASFTATSTTTAGAQVFPATSGITYDGVAGNGVFLWGAQVEASATVGTYSPTTTAANGGPRFDHDPTTLQPRGLLVEEVRTNLAPGTMTGGGYWNTVGAGTSTASGAAAPDGTSNGVTITEGGTVSAYGLNLASPLPTITASAPTTCSVFAKAGTCTWLRMLLVDGLTPTVSAQAWFNLTTGAVGTINVFTSTGGTPTAISADMQSAGAGYWRCSLTATLATATTGGIMLRMVSADGVTSDTGGKTMSFFGPQLEVGAFATSWIPTTTAAATRAGEVATMGSIAAWYNAPEGTLYSEFAATKIPPPATQYPVALDDGTVSNLLTVYIDNTSQLVGYLQTNGIGQLQSLAGAGATSGTVYRAAVAYRTNDGAASANGSTPTTDATVTLGAYTRLIIGNRADGARQFSGHVRRVRYWRSRRSNAELQAITA